MVMIHWHSVSYRTDRRVVGAWACEAECLAVVTHGGFLEAALLNAESQPIELDEASRACPSSWENAELRSYQVTKVDGGDGSERLRFELLFRVATTGKASRAPSRGPSRPRLQTPTAILARRRELDAARRQRL